jgi:ABC-type lipoprotein export system ATPase subunit
MTPRSLLNAKISDLVQEYKYTERFFSTNGLPKANHDQDFRRYAEGLNPLLLEDLGVTREDLIERFVLFLNRMENIRRGIPFTVRDICIIRGCDKDGKEEQHDITVRAGSITCIVGHTGSGKSRLLADIDWMAQGDTPTKRRILINGKVPNNEWRFSMEFKLVAQLSQNMNYVMDLSVKEFIRIHAESRFVEDVESAVRTVLDGANDLSGERFSEDTPLTSLSGGQSRALMVADTAHLSTSPIVLIDELENAGIHRRKALDLLVGKDKIVLIVTHDPLIALMGERRIVIKNGGIHKVLETTELEKREMARLKELDALQQKYRELVRSGEEICSVG